MWNGRDPAEVITFDGAKFGAVDQWSNGIITGVYSLMYLNTEVSLTLHKTAPSTAGNWRT